MAEAFRRVPISLEGGHGGGNLDHGAARQVDGGWDAGELGERLKLPVDGDLNVAAAGRLLGQVERPAGRHGVADGVGRRGGEVAGIAQDGVIEAGVAVDVVVEVVVVGVVAGV